MRERQELPMSVLAELANRATQVITFDIVLAVASGRLGPIPDYLVLNHLPGHPQRRMKSQKVN